MFAIDPDGVIRGTYAGSLRYVISRILTGYNYLVTQNGGTLEVVVLGRHGESAVPASTSNLPTTRSQTDWRRQQ